MHIIYVKNNMSGTLWLKCENLISMYIGIMGTLGSVNGKVALLMVGSYFTFVSSFSWF